MKMPRKINSNEKKDNHYCEKRQKNNDAVKKSREKTRQKTKETMDKVSQLKQVTKEEKNHKVFHSKTNLFRKT